tara:strand:- start:5468 stop:7249 length:1782 start_codon:yes stop_codon:yes gene_type:complete
MKNIKLIIKIFKTLDPRFKNYFIRLIGLMIISSIAELCSLASVIPFLTIIRNAENLLNFSYIKQLYNLLGLSNNGQLITIATIIFIAVNIIASLIRLVNIKYGAKIVARVGSELSTKLYKNVIFQPYSTIININTGDIVSKITADINITINVLNSVNQVFTSSLILITLLTALFSFNAKIATIAILTFGLSYISIALSVKNKLYLNSKKITNIQAELIKIIQESLGSIRDLIISNSQLYFSSIYRSKDSPLRMMLADNQFLGLAPRYLMEGVSICLIALLAFYFNTLNKNTDLLIPTLGALALAAQKLLPAIQQAYFSWVYIQGSTGSLEAVVYYLYLPSNEKSNLINSVTKTPFKTLEFIDVSFRYKAGNKYDIQNINIKINKGEKIGLMGPTGCGKSTTLDLMLGLLRPNKGKILINGLDVHDISNKERLISYQKYIAHVPQNIYLSDGTIIENIAFGIEKKLINSSRVKKAAKAALINNIIDNNKEGYYMNIGENGIKLSGGQRQRIGISRALYKDFDLLFLDEATSALDSDTEKKIIENLEKVYPDITIIMIAHRLETLYICDKVICMERGGINELITGSELKERQKIK